MTILQHKASDHRRFGRALRLRIRRILPAIILPAFLSACASWPELGAQCDQFGVLEANKPMGNIVHLKALYRDQLDLACADVKDAIATINPSAEVSGCAIPQANGSVLAFYWVGDRCAMHHEICHAKHGPSHTEKYLRDLESGVFKPHCPENELRFVSMK